MPVLMDIDAPGHHLWAAVRTQSAESTQRISKGARLLPQHRSYKQYGRRRIDIDRATAV